MKVITKARLREECTELNPWQPIESAPKGRPGFQATTADFDRIEWLVDDGREDRFYNQNSGNYTDKRIWSHWKELPEEPK